MFRLATLKDMKEGQCAVVDELLLHGPMRRRMMDLGVISGTKIECVIKSPCGDPTAFYIKGAVVALREEDSSKVTIRAVEDDKGVN